MNTLHNIQGALFKHSKIKPIIKEYPDAKNLGCGC